MAQLAELLGSRYPIIQGPVGQMNDPKLVAAVSEAGGYGLLALGFVSEIDQVKTLVAAVQDLTDKPFGANLMVAMNPNNEAILEVLATAGIRTVTTSAGSPGKIYPKIKALGMKGLHVVLAAPLALKAVAAGADGVIASGTESGGLRSSGPEATSMVLTPLVCDLVDVPVIAAGGIADGRGYRAALALGAQGVQLGTALLASEESPVSRAWKEAIIATDDRGTTLVPAGGITWRGIINERLRDLLASGTDLAQEYDMANMAAALARDDFDLYPAGGSQVGALIKEIRPVKEIIATMVA